MQGKLEKYHKFDLYLQVKDVDLKSESLIEDRCSRSNLENLSLDSFQIEFLKLSKSSQTFEKKGSSQKKSLIVTGIFCKGIFQKKFGNSCISMLVVLRF